MRLPFDMPARPRFPDAPIDAFAVLHGATPQQEELGGNPINCAACCLGRSGFGACVARCIATGQACDSGLRNCSPC
jgi:hypothetical protein